MFGSSVMLHMLLRQAHKENKPMAAAFLDLAKAFDMVSHSAILVAAKRAGMPAPLINYLTRMYASAEVQMGERRARCRKGVRQGGPLSPLLFILVMDRVVEAAAPNLGVEMGAHCIHSIAYADDLILVAKNQGDLQSKLDGLCNELKKVGMSLNVKKFVGITMVKDARRKT